MFVAILLSRGSPSNKSLWEIDFTCSLAMTGGVRKNRATVARRQRFPQALTFLVCASACIGLGGASRLKLGLVARRCT